MPALIAWGIWSACIIAMAIAMALIASAPGERVPSGWTPSSMAWFIPLGLSWFLAGASLSFAVFLVAAPLTFAPATVDIARFTVAAALLGIPASIGVAILRYRLYEIDVLINRTLVYGTTITIIGAGFVAATLALQALLRPLTGGSDLAIAGSTLATVAAFQPIRRWVQAAVDRRFYRSRYDATRTLDAFSARMRDEVDMDSLRQEVLDVVGTTVQPAHVSLWLRAARR